MKPSLVLIQKNGLASLTRCLRGLMDSTQGQDFELVVVNNQSNTLTQDFLGDFLKAWSLDIGSFFVVNVKEDLGVPALYNVGTRVATKNPVVTFTCDMIFGEGWLTNLLTEMEKTPGAVLSPDTIPSDPDLEKLILSDWASWEGFSHRIWTKHIGERLDGLSPWCVGRTQETIKALGEFNESFKTETYGVADYHLRAEKEKFPTDVCLGAVTYRIPVLPTDEREVEKDQVQFSSIWKTQVAGARCTRSIFWKGIEQLHYDGWREQ